MLWFDVFIRRCAITVMKGLNYFYCLLLKKELAALIKKNPKTILLVNPQGYGDVVTMTAALRALRNRFKKSRIIVVVSKKGTEVLKNCSYADELVEYNPNFKQYFRLVKKLRSKHIDLCIDPQETLSSLKRWIFPLLVKSKFRLCFVRGGFCGVFPDFPVPCTHVHMIDFYLSLVEPLTGVQNNKSPEVFFTKKESDWAKQFLCEDKKNVLIHVHSENPNHLWQNKSWARVADKISQNCNLIFTAPPNTGSVNEITKLMKSRPVIATPPSFNHLAALVARCNLLISIDTCTVHIASATKTPTVAVYGPTPVSLCGPYNPNQISLQKDTVCKGKCQQDNMRNIFSYIERCQFYKDNCINYITPEEVFKAAELLLKV